MPDKKNVLMLTNIPAPYKVQMLNELAEDINLTVLFERRSAKNREQEWLKESKKFNSIFLSGINIGNESSLSFSVLRYVFNKADTVFVSGYSSPTTILFMIIMRLIGRRFIMVLDGAITKNESLFLRVFKKKLINLASSFISTGDNTDTYLMNYGVNKKRIMRIPFSSISKKDILQKPLTKEQKQLAKHKIGIEQDYLILAIGQFIPRKGFDLLLKAAKETSENAAICIIGGKETDEYNKIVKEYDLKNIFFCPHFDKKTLEDYFLAADIFVHPTREDIWGLVINEAIGYGLPVISTEKCNAAVELLSCIDKEFILKTVTPSLIAEKINKILEDDTLRENISQKSLDLARDYTIESMAEIYLQIINKSYKS